jgi:hypothetical protein
VIAFKPLGEPMSPRGPVPAHVTGDSRERSPRAWRSGRRRGAVSPRDRPGDPRPETRPFIACLPGHGWVVAFSSWESRRSCETRLQTRADSRWSSISALRCTPQRPRCSGAPTQTSRPGPGDWCDRRFRRMSSISRSATTLLGRVRASSTS